MYAVEHLPLSNCVELVPLVHFEGREKASELGLGEQSHGTKQGYKSSLEELPSVEGTERKSE